ncbi:MAG: 16S rRNA (adenine(1518)-N(6)/adenine(1519)-N(6))-dimethyltransferase RsmA [Bacteroidales bacterium]
MVQPKKHWGQHFLTDPSIAARIVDSLPLGQGDPVVEIGPGTGILTSLLLEREMRLTPVEIDPEAAAYLRDRWPRLDETLVEGDFLKMAPGKELPEVPFRIIGNFPYNISSQIFFRVLDWRDLVPSVVCMIQKEVADRLASPPGSRDYGILSVLLQAYYRIETLFRVKPGSFHPPPKVHSAVIRLTRNDTVALPCNEALFREIVKTCFQQRRKMIRNSIRPILLPLDDSTGLLSKRPEQLDVNDFVTLTNWVEARRSQTTDQSNTADP